MNCFGRRANTVVVGFSVFALQFCVSLFLFPFIAVKTHELLPSSLTNRLFFWPQYLLLPNGLSKDDLHIAAGVSIVVAVAFWSFVGALFGYLTRTRGTLVRALAVYPVVIVIAATVHACLGLLGIAATLAGF